jgi:hypothetical protein
VLQTKAPVGLIGECDHLGIEGSILATHRLDAHLLELAVATVLRTLRAEERPRVPEFDR